MTRTLLLLVLAALSPPLLAGEQPRIAIIIDDLGYRMPESRRAIELPGPVACAFLPGAPRATELASCGERWRQGGPVALADGCRRA